MPKYLHPPVTEAIIGLEFEPELSQEDLKGAGVALYPSFDNTYRISNNEGNVVFDVGSIMSRGRLSGFQFANFEHTDISQLKENAVTFSRLSPYMGWKEFRKKSEEKWRKIKVFIEDKTIARVGINCINRIDIPIEKNSPIDATKFFQFRPISQISSSPTKTPWFDIFHEEEHDGVNVEIIVNFGIISSPIIDHISFALRIIVGAHQGIPKTDRQIWALLDNFQKRQNAAFDACITRATQEFIGR